VASARRIPAVSQPQTVQSSLRTAAYRLRKSANAPHDQGIATITAMPIEQLAAVVFYVAAIQMNTQAMTTKARIKNTETFTAIRSSFCSRETAFGGSGCTASLPVGVPGVCEPPVAWVLDAVETDAVADGAECDED
jgi:hypothetical protein